jgi:hypothetical protein
VTPSFDVHKLFILMQSHLSILSLTCWATELLFRRLLPMSICSRVFPTHSCSCFKVKGFTLRSLTVVFYNTETMKVPKKTWGKYSRYWYRQWFLWIRLQSTNNKSKHWDSELHKTKKFLHSKGRNRIFKKWNVRKY